MKLDCIGPLLSVKDSWDPDLERVLTVILNTGHQASLISAALSMEARSPGLSQWAHLGNRRVSSCLVAGTELRGGRRWVRQARLPTKHSGLKQIFASIIMAVQGDDLWLLLNVCNPFGDKNVILVLLIWEKYKRRLIIFVV